MPQWKAAFNRLTEKYNKNQPAGSIIDKVNIPVVLTNAKTQNTDAPIALLISGDGGWYAFEQLIADHLAKLGIPTIGLDSKKYFWKQLQILQKRSGITVKNGEKTIFFLLVIRLVQK